MNPEGQSIKPDDGYIDSEDLGLDKTEGDEIAARENGLHAGSLFVRTEASIRTILRGSLLIGCRNTEPESPFTVEAPRSRPLAMAV